MLPSGEGEVCLRLPDSRLRVFQSPILRRSRHADLDSACEVREDFMPVGVIIGTAPMTFVDDDEVEEIAGQLLVIVFFHAIVIPDELLVQPQENILRRMDVLVIDFLHRMHERIEILPHRLVDQDIPIREVQDFLERMGVPEAVNDLERAERLPRPRRHD